MLTTHTLLINARLTLLSNDRIHALFVTSSQRSVKYGPSDTSLAV